MVSGSVILCLGSEIIIAEERIIRAERGRSIHWTFLIRLSGRFNSFAYDFRVISRLSYFAIIIQRVDRITLVVCLNNIFGIIYEVLS